MLAKHARFRLRQYPVSTTPGGFEPPRTWCTHLAGEPLNHSGKVSRARPGFWYTGKKIDYKFTKYNQQKKKTKPKSSETGNRTPGICVTGRDVTNYTISDGTPGVSGFRSQYLVLAKHARFRLRQYPCVGAIRHPRFPRSPLP